MTSLYIAVFLWDIYLANEKETSSFKNNDLTMYNSAFIALSFGVLNFNRELLSNIQCSMDLRNFPHDVQHCEMSFMTFSLAVERIEFVPTILCGLNQDCDSVSVVESSAFKMISVNTSVIMTQNRPELHVKFTFQRQLQFYLYQVINFCSNNINMFNDYIWLASEQYCTQSSKLLIEHVME